jgi:hypothetical protein
VINVSRVKRGRGNQFNRADCSFLRAVLRFGPLILVSCQVLRAFSSFSQDISPPVLIFNTISIQLDSAGLHALSGEEIARIASGSWDPSGITNTTTSPSTFNFCDVGQKSITLSLTDSFGNTTNRTGPIQVLAPNECRRTVYVDASYPRGCSPVGFPFGNGGRAYFVGFNAFNRVQDAIEQVDQNGVVYIAAGTYAENITIRKPICVVGPNAGTIGRSANRQPEARIIPQHSDPENAPIISVESDDVVIEGLLLDGSNSSLAGGYNANGVRVHAAAGIQNGTYPNLADVAGITIRNNVITNISYDGICLDRYQYFGTSSAWNYIRNNTLANMWEGILTYAVDSVITDNVITNVTHGLGVHCVTTAAPKGFFPLVASNVVTIAQWWPVEIQVARAPGIWINYRRERASPIAIVGNIVETPVMPPSLKTIIGLYALTVDEGRKVRFIDNVVNGEGNCTVGLLAASCYDSVELQRGSLRKIGGIGVLADTLDTKWGPGNSSVTVSNVEITLSPAAVGALALQEAATESNVASVVVTGNTSISGGICGVQVSGANASALVRGTAQHIENNKVGVHVSNGRALLEGNILTNNGVAAVVVENNGLVDAGDCSGLNLTGLSGNGINGASAGLNDFSGYGFDKLEPWVIKNAGPIPVLADRNVFNAGPSEKLEDGVSGLVRFSDSGLVTISAPPPIAIQCLSEVPPPAKTVQEFIAVGGVLSGGTATSISSHDVVVTNRAGHYSITRSYRIGGGCTEGASCEQMITARDNQSPTLRCSENIVQGVDPGCDYATVTFTNLAADSCGELLGTWVPVSTGQFSAGTNIVIVIATDLANNSSACSFEIAIIALPAITLQPASRTNKWGTTARFKVAATSLTPMTFRWKKNGIALVDTEKVSGATSDELVLSAVTESDVGDYSVDVSNLAGTTSSATAHLDVITSRGDLRILDVSGGVVTLELIGPGGSRFAIFTSTNLSEWARWQVNTAPFILIHTNPAGSKGRFYRAIPVP